MKVQTVFLRTVRNHLLLYFRTVGSIGWWVFESTPLKTVYYPG